MKLETLILAAAAPLAAGLATAHHASSMFDTKNVAYRTGTVSRFEFVNPHAWVHVMLADANGETRMWSFEAGSIAQLTSLGWTADSFKPGDEVEIGFHPMMDGSRGGQFMNAVLADGTKVCSNRGCGDGTGSVLAPF